MLALCAKNIFKPYIYVTWNASKKVANRIYDLAAKVLITSGLLNSKC